MIMIPELSESLDFQAVKGIGANNGLHFMLSRILTPSPGSRQCVNVNIFKRSLFKFEI